MIGSTDLFYTLPEHPELRGLDLDYLRDGLEFAWNATALVVDTYLVAALAPTNRIYEGRHLSAQRFKASNVNDILTCRSCRKLSGTCRPLRDWDRFPFHFGCRCFLLLECDPPTLNNEELLFSSDALRLLERDKPMDTRFVRSLASIGTCDLESALTPAIDRIRNDSIRHSGLATKG